MNKQRVWEVTQKGLSLSHSGQKLSPLWASRPSFCSDLEQLGGRFCPALWLPIAGVILEAREQLGSGIPVSFLSCLDIPCFLHSESFPQLCFLAEAELREPTPLLSVPYWSGLLLILRLGHVQSVPKLFRDFSRWSWSGSFCCPGLILRDCMWSLNKKPFWEFFPTLYFLCKMELGVRFFGSLNLKQNSTILLCLCEHMC